MLEKWSCLPRHHAVLLCASDAAVSVSNLAQTYQTSTEVMSAPPATTPAQAPSVVPVAKPAEVSAAAKSRDEAPKAEEQKKTAATTQGGATAPAAPTSKAATLTGSG